MWCTENFYEIRDNLPMNVNPRVLISCTWRPWTTAVTWSELFTWFMMALRENALPKLHWGIKTNNRNAVVNMHIYYIYYKTNILTIDNVACATISGDLFQHIILQRVCLMCYNVLTTLLFSVPCWITIELLLSPTIKRSQDRLVNIIS